MNNTNPTKKNGVNSGAKHHFSHIYTDRMLVEFTTTWIISAYHHQSFEFESRSWWGAFDTTLCDKVCQWLATGRCFSPVSSNKKTDRHVHDIAEILLKVALSTIPHNHKKVKLVAPKCYCIIYYFLSYFNAFCNYHLQLLDNYECEIRSYLS